MIQKSDIKNIFQDYDKRTISFLENVVLGVGGTCADFFSTNLLLLADQLEIYFRASDIVRKNPITCTTQKGSRQSPELDVMQKAWTHIVTMLRESGITKYSKTKIDRLQRSDSTEESDKLIEMLTA